MACTPLYFPPESVFVVLLRLVLSYWPWLSEMMMFLFSLRCPSRNILSARRVVTVAGKPDHKVGPGSSPSSVTDGWVLTSLFLVCQENE